MLEQIRQRLESLNKSERKVANVILQDPQSATRMSIATLAQASNVSEPTVNRFCRNFDATGYPDFKIQLAQSLAGGTSYVSRNVEQDDSVKDYTDKIFTSTMAALDDTRRNIDASGVERAVDFLIQAKQITFFWLGCLGCRGERCTTQVLSL